MIQGGNHGLLAELPKNLLQLALPTSPTAKHVHRVETSHGLAQDLGGVGAMVRSGVGAL
jgi:hypothetical protein